MLRKFVLATLLVFAATAAVAAANHIPGHPCSNCVSHKEWPTINGKFHKANGSARTFRGSRRSDELLGHHGSDTLHGKGGSDVLWGDWQGGASQPSAPPPRPLPPTTPAPTSLAATRPVAVASRPVAVASRPVAAPVPSRPATSSATPSRPVSRRPEPSGMEARPDGAGTSPPKRPIGAIPRS